MSFPRISFVVCSILTAVSAGIGQNSKENADFKLAINLYNDGLYDLAAEQLKQFINSYPNAAQGIDARFTLGLAQLKLKQFDDSRLTFQTFALTYQDNPKAPDAWWNVGESFAAVKNYREAALAFERVKVFHPKSKLAPDALLQAGKYFVLSGQRDDARRVLRIVLQEYGASQAVPAARTQLGGIYFEEGNLGQAQNELKRVIESDPSADAKAQALLILGNIEQAMGRIEQAQSDYQEIITKYRSTSALQGAFMNLGRLDANSGRYPEAVDNLRKSLAEKESVDTVLVREATIGLGDAYAALGDFSSATAAYERFLATSPQDEHVPEIQWKLADASARGKKFKKSNDACTRLLKSSAPETYKRHAQIRIALNAQEQKNSALAIQLFEEFAAQNPDDASTPEILLRVGTIADKELHDSRKASTTYEFLARRYPHSTLVDDALAGAGSCYEQLKEYDRALQTYRTLVEKYPASEFRHEAQERIRMIETFEAKDKDSGLEKLALLVGDVVAEKDKGGLAFRLGEIYFHDLKNYAAAATQFTNAMKSGMNDDQKVEAQLLRARCFECLSWKDTTLRPTAVEAYQSFLHSAPPLSRKDQQPSREDAALGVFNLSATDLAGARAAYSSTMELFHDFHHRDTMLLRLGNLLADADSSNEALAAFAEIANRYPSSRSAEEAGFRKFELFLSMGLADSAMNEGTTFLEEHPAGTYSAVMLSRLAELSLQKGDAEHAAELLQKLTSGFSYTSLATEGVRRLADAYSAGGQYREAIDLYAETIAQHSANLLDDSDVDPSLLLALGKAEYLGGDAREAKKSLFQFLARQHKGELAGEAYATLGMIYRSEGATDVAASYFRQAEAASPGTAASRDIADLLFTSGEYADAARQYAQLSQTAKDETEKQYFDARIIVAHLRTDETGRADKEIAVFVKSYKEKGEDLATFELEKGLGYYRQQDYVRALKTFRRVIEKYEGTSTAPAAMYWSGKTLEATGKPTEAVEQMNTLIKEYPQAGITCRAYLALGNIYYSAERWDESIKNYRKIIDDPNVDSTLLPLAMSNLIETYETAGINDAALSLTRKYLELYPNSQDNFDKRIKIGILYERLGYYDQAVLHLQSLLDEAGSDLEGEIRYYIADANYNKGNYQQAILDFLKVPYLVTKKGKIDWTANSLYMSGQSYEKMGRYDQALTMYQQIIDRPGIDGTFKAAAKKEIDRVKLVLKKKTN